MYIDLFLKALRVLTLSSATDCYYCFALRDGCHVLFDPTLRIGIKGPGQTQTTPQALRNQGCW